MENNNSLPEQLNTMDKVKQATEIPNEIFINLKRGTFDRRNLFDDDVKFYSQNTYGLKPISLNEFFPKDRQQVIAICDRGEITRLATYRADGKYIGEFRVDYNDKNTSIPDIIAWLPISIAGANWQSSNQSGEGVERLKQDIEIKNQNIAQRDRTIVQLDKQVEELESKGVERLQWVKISDGIFPMIDEEVLGEDNEKNHEVIYMTENKRFYSTHGGRFYPVVWQRIITSPTHETPSANQEEKSKTI